MKHAIQGTLVFRISVNPDLLGVLDAFIFLNSLVRQVEDRYAKNLVESFIRTHFPTNAPPREDARTLGREKASDQTCFS